MGGESRKFRPWMILLAVGGVVGVVAALYVATLAYNIFRFATSPEVSQLVGTATLRNFTLAEQARNEVVTSLATAPEGFLAASEDRGLCSTVTISCPDVKGAVALLSTEPLTQGQACEAFAIYTFAQSQSVSSSAVSPDTSLSDTDTVESLCLESLAAGQTFVLSATLNSPDYWQQAVEISPDWGDLVASFSLHRGQDPTKWGIRAGYSTRGP